VNVTDQRIYYKRTIVSKDVFRLRVIIIISDAWFSRTRRTWSLKYKCRIRYFVFNDPREFLSPVSSVLIKRRVEKNKRSLNGLNCYYCSRVLFTFFFALARIPFVTIKIRINPINVVIIINYTIFRRIKYPLRQKKKRYFYFMTKTKTTTITVH